MAFTWSHGGWRRLTDFSARRDELVLHIEEIEAKIGDWETQKSLDQEGRRNLTALQDMLKRREEDLSELEDALGITPGQSVDEPFVELRPR